MYDFKPVTVSRKSSLEERQFALTQIYQQVLERQPYTSERQTLTSLEKDFLKDKIGVRRFLRHFACSDVYLNQFYYKRSNMKFIEGCFKHLLGRTIRDQQEMHIYCDIWAKRGVSGLIAAILDSDEYNKSFGCFTVPYSRQHGYYQTPEAIWANQFAAQLLDETPASQERQAVPVVYWEQLGLVCNNGVCHRPEIEITPDPVSEQLQDSAIDILMQRIETINKMHPAVRAEQVRRSMSRSH